MTDAIYNEIDSFAADWIERLVDAGHIAPGRVFRRSIAALAPADVAGLGQRHFFAGIGVWSYALRLAGVPDNANIWTGSCPCQPFSDAGTKGGLDDDRHLWPEWFRLIRECRPAIVFGEQVASRDGLAWLDAVRADLEGADYALGAADLCAAGVGAPHRRQRLYFVAYDDATRWPVERAAWLHDRRPHGNDARGCGANGDLADAAGEQHDRGVRARRRQPEPTDRCCDVGDAARERCGAGRMRVASGRSALEPDRPGATRGFWHPADWIWCTDDRWRPVEPGAFPLAHGVAERVGRLRGYGNAIVAPLAAAFVAAALDAIHDVIITKGS